MNGSRKGGTYICNGILLNHKRDWYWSFVEMWLDPARVCHTDCSKSEGEKQSYINTYMWNLCRFVCVLGPPTSPSWNYSRDTNPPLISPAPKCPLYNSPLQVWACSTWHDLLTTVSSYLTPDLSHYMQNCWWLLFMDLWVSPQKKAMMQLLVWLCFRVITYQHSCNYCSLSKNVEAFQNCYMY